MTYILSISVFFIISWSCTGKKDCSKLRDGEFYYKGDSSFAGSIIKRNDSVQIVIDKKTGKRLEEKITWVDSCTYVLCPLPGTEYDSSSSDLFPITVTVLGITKKYYTVNITSRHDSTDFNDTVWISR